jgi:hypothetical protein
MSDAEEGLLFLVISVTIFATYLYHLFSAIDLWRIERSARSFRGAFIAVMLQLGLLRIVLAVAARVWPEAQIIVILNAITAPILSLLLLSGGVVLIYTWRHDIHREHERERG